MKKLFPGVTVRKFPDLSDGESLQVDAETTLRVLHTPGHCEDHCCFVLDQEKAIFSGDNVLGIGSPWFEHLGDYMASLQKMATIATNRQLSTIYPSHGPPSIENALAMIQDTAKHRMEREAQIIKALSSKKNEARGDQDDDGNRVVDMRRSPKSALTSLQLVYRIYDASLPTMLVPAAQSNVLSHLHKLKAESAVCHAGLDRWYL